MPSYPQYDYEASTTILYRTNLYSGSDPDVDATERFSIPVDLTQRLFAVCELKFDASGATDDLKVNLYRSPDRAFDGDELEILSTTIDSDGSEDLWSLVIGPDFGPGWYRFGLKSTGATDTFDVEFTARRARFQIATV